jgi:hypothetical protein
VIGFDLSPVDALQLHRLGAVGFATERGGPTSHAAIVARALGLPFVFGVHGLVEAVQAGDMLCVDANFKLYSWSAGDNKFSIRWVSPTGNRLNDAALAKIRDVIGTLPATFEYFVDANAGEH